MFKLQVVEDLPPTFSLRSRNERFHHPCLYQTKSWAHFHFCLADPIFGWDENDERPRSVWTNWIPLTSIFWGSILQCWKVSFFQISSIFLIFDPVSRSVPSKFSSIFQHFPSFPFKFPALFGLFSRWWTSPTSGCCATWSATHCAWCGPSWTPPTPQRRRRLRSASCRRCWRWEMGRGDDVLMLTWC